MNEIKINGLKNKDVKDALKLIRKRYHGVKKQKFYVFYRDFGYSNNIKFKNKLFVARDKTKLVGFCWAIAYEHEKNKGTGFIEEIYVDKNYRRHGVGKKLVQAAMDFLKTCCTVMFITVADSMPDSMEFCKSAGLGRISGSWYVFGLK